MVERESQAVRTAPAAQQPKRLGARLTVNIITLLLSTAAVVVAGASLALAIDTSARDYLAATFTAPMGPSVRIDDGIRSITPSTVVDTVITNTGRLPLTIVNVWNGNSEGDHFAWTRVEDNTQTDIDTGVELDVGQAIAVRVYSPGTVTRWPPMVLTSDGATRQLHDEDTPAEATAAVEAAYAALPDCSEFL
ncbi:hypothetical protein MicroSTF_12425 [Microbacterium sp. STF-2]|uniref:hypothetical protein n=1 Tax=Microbacterium sp. STF-2 TaxID=3031132 RepID=UPI002AFFC736|nr:hypothetical protein [Microbacterium sp. STF-2]MEA1263838.1 hypothetical protein [Microbacterium sp. STF-2]